MSHVATARIGAEYLEVMAIGNGEALVADLNGNTRKVPFTDLVDVWPLSKVLDNFDELTESFNADGIEELYRVFTGSKEWAALVREKWEELY